MAESTNWKQTLQALKLKRRKLLPGNKPPLHRPQQQKPARVTILPCLALLDVSLQNHPPHMRHPPLHLLPTPIPREIHVLIQKTMTWMTSYPHLNTKRGHLQCSFTPTSVACNHYIFHGSRFKTNPNNFNYRGSL